MDCHEALQGAETAVLLVELLHFVFEVELAAEAIQQAVVPLLRRQVLADCGQVEHGDGGARLPQPDGRADHQRGLAHLRVVST